MPRSLVDLVPVGLIARRRWGAKEARAILKRLEGSGLSVREFAARHGVDAHRLYRWRAQLGSAGVAPAPAFVEIKAAASAAIEVALRSGHVIRVPDGFAEETLRRVVAALEGSVAPC
jgi:transposase-like protein